MAQDPTNPISEDDLRSVYMTFPDEATAAHILRRLLDERLIACANLLPAARSMYRWEGAVQDEPEMVAFAKTIEKRLADVVARVRELHPYDAPCVVGLEVKGGFRPYLDWVREETTA